jgi:Ca-activated chloride channel family protein
MKEVRMTRRTRASRCSLLLAATIVSLMAVFPSRAAAQGWIEPRPGIPPERFGIEKLRTNVTVRVHNRVATVEVEEWFRNNGGGLGEGDYVYPLPGEAVFSGYSLYQGDEELRGEMLDAARARDIYERIVRAKRDPALIELMGKGMLRARVFPIEPGQTRRITLRYTQVLERTGDAFQFRYLAGARHSAGVTPVPMPMPRPGRPAPQQERGGMNITRDDVPLSFTMVVQPARDYRDAFSPTHELRVERDGDRMTVRPRDELTGDFNVFLPLARAGVGLSFAAHRPDSDNGYFMLTLLPGEVAQSRVPRDVTVVVDVSGSMSGEKLEQARGALRQLLGTLGAADRLRLIAFSSSVRSWREGWTAATRADLQDARDWVDDLRADGGTNISDALEEAFRSTTPASRLPVIIFMTDGLPTNGETNAERIAAMAESQRGRARVFAFGVGYDVNTYLLDRLSEAARGSTQYVRPGEDVEEALASLAERIRYPVLTDLALERTGARITEVYPRNLPDLFAGEELVLFGRYDGAGPASLAITGRRGERSERYTTDVRLPNRTERNEYIARLWAARKIGDLDRRIRTAQADGASHRQVEEMIEELRRTALRYGLLSEHTAYLVQEPGMVADAQLRQRGSIGAAPPPPAAPARSGGPVSGQAAVARAESARRSREAANIADVEKAQALTLSEVVVTGTAASGTRVVAGRSFTLRKDVWEDVSHAASKRVVHVEPYSPAYFALLRALPELNPVLRELEFASVSGTRLTVRVARGGVSNLSQSEITRIVTEFRQR